MDAGARAEGGQTGGARAEERPWIGVHFACSNRYVRVHRRADGSGYLARCPACGRVVRFRVGEGGTNARFFEVSC
ncbi:MAG: hypothetical protein R3B57_12005 [Phycisphaerales bacterium]